MSEVQRRAKYGATQWKRKGKGKRRGRLRVRVRRRVGGRWRSMMKIKHHGSLIPPSLRMRMA